MMRQLKTLKKAQLKNVVKDMVKKIEDVKGVKLIAEQVSLSSDEMRQLADDTMSEMKSGVIVFAAPIEGRCQVIARVSDDMIDKGIKANAIIKAIAPIIGGGGGGKAHFAQAGGKTPDKISEALSTVKTLLSS